MKPKWLLFWAVVLVLVAVGFAMVFWRGQNDRRDAPKSAPTKLAAVQQVQSVWPEKADDQSSPEPMEPFGHPQCDFDDNKHTLIRKYSGFEVDYDDRVLAPRWSSYKLTRDALTLHKDIKREPTFWGDTELSLHGLAITEQRSYSNPRGQHIWDRGHMTPFDGKPPVIPIPLVERSG